jgi:hypothetical protein
MLPKLYTCLLGYSRLIWWYLPVSGSTRTSENRGLFHLPIGTPGSVNLARVSYKVQLGWPPTGSLITPMCKAVTYVMWRV